MKKEIIENVFTQEEIFAIQSVIDYAMQNREHNHLEAPSPEISAAPDVKYYRESARIDIEYLSFPKEIVDKITTIANRYTEDLPLELIPFGGHYAEYTGKLGDPFLGPHYDGGDCNFMIDYQLESNTTWGIGMNEDIYELKDNEALTLYPLSYVHYRPQKKFSPDEYVKMVFFRFTKPGNPKTISPELSEEEKQKINNMYKNYYGEK